jgi:hypothetical protein
MRLAAYDPRARYLTGFDPRARYLTGLGIGSRTAQQKRRVRRMLMGLGQDDLTSVFAPPVVMPYDMVGPLAPGEILAPPPAEIPPSLATGSGGSTSWNYSGPTPSGPIQSAGSIYGGLPNAGPGYASSMAVPGSVPVGGSPIAPGTPLIPVPGGAPGQYMYAGTAAPGTTMGISNTTLMFGALAIGLLAFIGSR